MGRWTLFAVAAAVVAAVAGTSRGAAAEEVQVDAATGEIDPATNRVIVPWPESEDAGAVGTGPAQRVACLADGAEEDWIQELLELHHATYPDSVGSGKQLIGLAMSAAPRPNGEHFHTVLESLPPWLPVLFHSRLNYSLIYDPQICAEVRATPVYPQLQDPSKLNRQVDYRATHVKDDVERTTWRSKIVLDVARTLSEASKLFHYVLYVEDDVALSPGLFKLLPFYVRGRMRMDVAETFAEDQAAGHHAFLTNYNKDQQDHRFANGDPWAMMWLSRQGMLATLWDGRYLDEAVTELQTRFDEKPVDWLVRQIKHDKGWNTPVLSNNGRKQAFVNHLGKRSTFKADKRARQLGGL